jgi:hypothetical protein
MLAISMIRETNFSLKAVLDEISYWVPDGKNRTDGWDRRQLVFELPVLYDRFYILKNGKTTRE